MEIIKTKNDNTLTVKVTGKLDTTTAPELSDSLKEDLDTIEELILDFSDLIYISSAGLRVILATQKTMSAKGTMKITNLQDIVLEVFTATGLVDILTIE